MFTKNSFLRLLSNFYKSNNKQLKTKNLFRAYFVPYQEQDCDPNKYILDPESFFWNTIYKEIKNN
jgi:hypothetical protein